MKAFFENYFANLMDGPRWRRRVVSAIVDILLLFLSFFFAMALRLDSLEFFQERRGFVAIAMIVPLTLAILSIAGVYRVVVRYFTTSHLVVLTLCLIGSSALLLVLPQAVALGVPRSVPPIFGLLAVFSLGGARLTFRELYKLNQMKGRIPVIIYGAGSSGRQLLNALERGQEYQPVAFIDDAKALQSTVISGKKVYPAESLPHLLRMTDTQLILLAMPATRLGRRKQIITDLSKFAVPIRTIPGMADLVSGRQEISSLREIALEDLLGREPIEPDPELMGAILRNKSVLVSGAGGSIGSELCRQIMLHQPRAIVLLESSEVALYRIEHDLKGVAEAEGTSTKIIPILGSVLDENLLNSLFSMGTIQTIFHAAAYKHVPLVEMNVIAGIRNNVFGTRLFLQAALKAKVETFMLVSTDKAVRPTNIMGASKRLAELVCQASASSTQDTRISMVRFGNVLGSSGSVIPLFKEQISSGGPLTVTHPEITRYFMSIPEAAQLVIQAGAMAKGGDVFLLDMGKPVRIAELADRMARLSGLAPFIRDHAAGEAGDIEIRFTGLRPGEKLYEELLIGEAASKTRHPRIMTADETRLSPEVLSAFLADLEDACSKRDISRVREILISAQTGYAPDGEIVDLCWVSDLH
jgi:FlaA1/EpsC-like NDP-sugar epimerase